MSFIIQRKHNECAIAVTRYVLDFYKVNAKYNYIKLLLSNNFSLARIKFVVGTYGFQTVCYHIDDKDLDQVYFDIAIIQIKNYFGFHYLCLIKKDGLIKVYNPSFGLIKKYSNNVKNKWTGYILTVFK